MKIKQGIWRITAAAVFAVMGLASANAALKEDTADIHLNYTMPPMKVTLKPGGAEGGCPAGQNWDITYGGCTPALTLRNMPTTQACGCTCPDQGTCTAQQTGSYNVMGWRLPPSGTEMIYGNSPTTWGACSQTSNACYASPPPVTPTEPSTPTDPSRPGGSTGPAGAPVFTSISSRGGSTYNSMPTGDSASVTWSAQGILPTTTYTIHLNIGMPGNVKGCYGGDESVWWNTCRKDIPTTNLASTFYLTTTLRKGSGIDYVNGGIYASVTACNDTQCATSPETYMEFNNTVDSM